MSSRQDVLGSTLRSSAVNDPSKKMKPPPAILPPLPGVLTEFELLDKIDRFTTLVFGGMGGGGSIPPLRPATPSGQYPDDDALNKKLPSLIPTILLAGGGFSIDPGSIKLVRDKEGVGSLMFPVDFTDDKKASKGTIWFKAAKSEIALEKKSAPSPELKVTAALSNGGPPPSTPSDGIKKEDITPETQIVFGFDEHQIASANANRR
jgi:hypothetical protein